MNSKNSTWDNIPGFNREKEQYVQLDLTEWLRAHRIKEEGEHRGSTDQPATEDDTLDEFESQIVDWVNRRGIVCRGNVGAHLSDLEGELADMENDAALAILGDSVKEMKKEAEVAIADSVDAGRNGLTEVEAVVRNGSAEFVRFQRRSRLTRLPDYAHRGTAFWFIGICGFVEILLNASLLMDVNPFGLIGSTMQMTLISLVNVGFAGLAMAVLLRQSNHVAGWRKALAWLGVVLLVPVVLGFNLGVGHYRNSMQASLSDPSADFLTMGNDALQRLIEGPFDLVSFQTALLVLLGMVCFGIGTWKWFQRDDAYPGYGRLDRQLRAEKSAYRRAYECEQGRLKHVHERYQSRLEDIRHKLVVNQSKWREVCARGGRLVEDYPTNLAQYQHDLEFLLAAYRTANKSARGTPAPPHFAEPVEVDKAILTPPGFNPPPETSLDGVAGEVNSAVLALQEAYGTARKEYLTLAAVTKQGVAEVRKTEV